MPSSGVSKGVIWGTRKIRCPLFWCDVPSQSRQAVPAQGSHAGRPSAPGRAWEHPSGAARWAQLRFEVKCGASRVLRSPGNTRYPGLEGLREGVPGSRGQPGVGVSLPTGCQGHSGRAAGKAGPLRCGDWGSATWRSGCQSGPLLPCPGRLGTASPGARCPPAAAFVCPMHAAAPGSPCRVL